jgi:hypothetical protein
MPSGLCPIEVPSLKGLRGLITRSPSTDVLGYDCDALRAEVDASTLFAKAGEKDGAPMSEKPGQDEGVGRPPRPNPG